MSPGCSSRSTVLRTRLAPSGSAPGQGAELPQHDVDAHRGDEARHDRRRHEAQQGATSKEPGSDHDDAGEHGEGEERPLGIGGRAETGVRHDERHGSGGLHRHEGAARDEGRPDHAEEVGVEPRQRVDPGEETARQPVGDALDAEHDPGGRVLAQPLGGRATGVTGSARTKGGPAPARAGRRRVIGGSPAPSDAAGSTGWSRAAGGSPSIQVVRVVGVR